MISFSRTRHVAKLSQEEEPKQTIVHSSTASCTRMPFVQLLLLTKNVNVLEKVIYEPIKLLP